MYSLEHAADRLVRQKSDGTPNGVALFGEPSEATRWLGLGLTKGNLNGVKQFAQSAGRKSAGRKSAGRRMGETSKQVQAEQHAHQLWLSSVTQDPTTDPLQRTSKLFFSGGTPQFKALQAVLDAVRTDLEDDNQQVTLTEFPACPVAVRMVGCITHTGPSAMGGGVQGFGQAPTNTGTWGRQGTSHACGHVENAHGGGDCATER